MNELDELYRRYYDLEERINLFFEGDENPHYGDRGYQELLEEMETVNEEINELIEIE